MVQSTCKTCGASFWETYRGARAESGEIGEDLCNRCEGERLCEVGDHDLEAGKCTRCGASLAPIIAMLRPAAREQIAMMRNEPMTWSRFHSWPTIRGSLEDLGLIRSLNQHAPDRVTEITALGVAVREQIRADG